MRKELLSILFFISSVFIVAVSGFVILGYVLDIVVLRSWGAPQQMALPTAILFLVIGVQNIIYLKLNK